MSDPLPAPGRWRVAALLLTLACAASGAEDSRAMQRSDGGYDFFDLSGTYLGQSVLNHQDSYDYYDAQGMFTGWSAARTSGQVDFYDAAGSLYRTIVIDAVGGALNFDAY